MVKKSIFVLLVSILFCTCTLGIIGNDDDLTIPFTTDMEPMPRISTGVPAYYNGSETLQTDPNDDDYSTLTFLSGDFPKSVAYDLSGVDESKRKTILVWFSASGSFQSFDLSSPQGQIPTYEPANIATYRIEGNTADGGSLPADGWVPLVSVDDPDNPNYWSERMHVIDFEGYKWIRMYILSGDTQWATKMNMDVHDASRGINDTWLFIGDSVVSNCFSHKGYSSGGSGQMDHFSSLIEDSLPGHYPAYINAGIGYMRSEFGAASIDKVLDAFPGRYVAICYGRNNVGYTLSEESLQIFYDENEYMVQAVLDRGKIPIIATTIYSSTYADRIPVLDAKLAELKEQYPEILDGPDIYSFFRDNYEYMDEDNIHPDPVDGQQKYINLWAEKMLEVVYSDYDE